MSILSIRSGHDGALAGVDSERGELLFSYEAEKDSHPKNAAVTAETFLEAASWFDKLPRIVALTGSAGTELQYRTLSGAGYFGIGPESQLVGKKTIFGQTVDFFSSTHERAHLWGAYAMSPFAQGQPVYVLIWDDMLGDFYRIDGALGVTHLGHVVDHPTLKFAFLYGLADPQGLMPRGQVRRGDFGRMLSAASGGDASAQDAAAEALIDRLLAAKGSALHKDDFRDTPFHDIGTDSPRFRALAARFSDRLFERFLDHAQQHLTGGAPLLIAGEGGLNCDWNNRWRDSGLFADVFVPPCANDTGCAIGTAVDAMRHFTGKAKLRWSVNAGQAFHDDMGVIADAEVSELDLSAVAQALKDGQVIAWARGNCEIGPRALGNRSILAAPFDPQMRARLNRIKGRADSAPISPVCLAEDAARHFDGWLPSPYMLFFQQVTDPSLGAVTHQDGSARIQTVTRDQNPMLYDLLCEFKRLTGVGVLCNTSLNFPGAGFINKTSDLDHFARSTGIDGFLAGIRFIRPLT